MTEKTDTAALREAALKATQGEWWQDVVETDGSYGDPGNGGTGFHSYAVYGPDNRSLLDMTNSSAALIETEDDGDYRTAWDETGRRNAEFIALANPSTIIALLDQLEAERQQRAQSDSRTRELEFQWKQRAPTQWAYDQACAALHAQLDRAKAAEKELAETQADERSSRICIAELRKKLAKPVELPAMTPAHLTDKHDGWNPAIGQCAVAIRLAGFRVEGDQ